MSVWHKSTSSYLAYVRLSSFSISPSSAHQSPRLCFGCELRLSFIHKKCSSLIFFYQFASGYFSPWVTSFMFALDAILLLNGVHIAYVFFKKMEAEGRVSILRMYIHRYLKVTPYVALLILLLLTLTRYSSDGPYYKLVTETQRPACETYFWSAVLHVQNYVNPDNIVS